MFRPYGVDVGRFLVKLARRAVREYLERGIAIEPPPETPGELLRDNYGVFTTIEVKRGDRYELRGCIGFPRGYQNVARATIASAIAACCEDPRFPPMKLGELNNVVFEVSVLSPLRSPEVSRPRDYLNVVVVGKHGIVVEKGPYGGLLLPQVPVDYCWDVQEYLMEACAKALLPGDCWLDEDTTILLYEAQVFREVDVDGDVIERDLVREYSERCRR